MIKIRDASNFDGSVDYAGLAGFTHKATEGTTVVHDRYGPRLTAARDFGVPVLGAYHVVRTPGSGGNGSLSNQLAFWINYLDNHTPWWQDHPHFILQIDAEKWPYDPVSASVVKQFAAMLVAAGGSAWKVTYASRGQYGDSLRGIATPLWNADYRGGPGYPGDNWAPGWAPYSGQVPVFLQYTSTPYDQSAFRGSLDQLLALIDTNQNGATPMSGPLTPTEDNELLNVYAALLLGGPSCGPVVPDPVNTGPTFHGNSVVDLLQHIRKVVDNPAPAPVALSDADRAALVAGLVADLVSALRGELLAEAQAEVTALQPPQG